MGKGTAVKDKADIDCVVFLNNVKTMEEHKSYLPETKNCLESCLGESPYAGQITFDEQTHFAVKFTFRLDNPSREFHIDLLPTFTTDQSPGKISFQSSFNPTTVRFCAIFCIIETTRYNNDMENNAMCHGNQHCER